MEKDSKIPKEGIIKAIIESAVDSGEVASQSELAQFIREKLIHGDEHYKISEKRARLIALDIPGMVINVETKDGEIPDKCPCCSGELHQVHMRNLKGERVLLKLVCAQCSYEGRENKWIPRRYTFTKKS